MADIGVQQVLQAFKGQVRSVCSVQVFVASHNGMEVVIEVRDYGPRPGGGQFEVEVRRRDGARVSRSAVAETLEDACSGIQWHQLEDVTGDIAGLETWSRGPTR